MLPVHVAFFAVVAFFLVRLVPGDPVRLAGGPDMSDEEYTRIQQTLGLDGSIFSQLWGFLSKAVTGDLGTSAYTGKTVMSEFEVRLPATLELAIIALVLSILFSIAAAYLVLTRPGNVVSRALTVYARTAGAIPQYLLAVVAIFVFYASLHWAPAPIGRMGSEIPAIVPITNFPMLDAALQARPDAVMSMLTHLALPLAVLVLSQTDLLIKILVRGLDDEVDTPATWFRVACGVKRRKVIISVYRRALPQLVVLLAAMFGFLLGGAVLLEDLFSLGAMGQYAVDAINTKDVAALQGFLLLSAAVSLVVFLLADIANMILDPRRRPGVAKGGSE
jgi:peptide/nickel transport system permease protein